MKKRIVLTFLMLCCGAIGRAGVPDGYEGRPYADEVYKGGAQAIPGRVECALFDLGGEGVGYHDVDAVNHGSGELNLDKHHQRPASKPYFWAFRIGDGMDISYTKDFVDFSEKNLVTPKVNQVYVGWTADGEWCNYTVNVKEAGTYRISALYSNEAKEVAFDINGRPAAKCRMPVATGDWHHWNKDVIGTITFDEAGEQLLTFRYNGGNNFAYFDFEPVEAVKAP